MIRRRPTGRMLGAVAICAFVTFRPVLALAAAAGWFVLSGGAACALTCAQPLLDAARIAEAAVIFEGTAGPPRPLTPAERSAFRASAAETKGGNVDTLRVFAFAVTKAWKGVAAGERVEVLFNTAWGDTFAEGVAVLVVGPRRIGGLVWAPLCGNTTDVDHARQSGDLARLEQILGEGGRSRSTAGALRRVAEAAGSASRGRYFTRAARRRRLEAPERSPWSVWGPGNSPWFSSGSPPPVPSRFPASGLGRVAARWFSSKEMRSHAISQCTSARPSGQPSSSQIRCATARIRSSLSLDMPQTPPWRDGDARRTRPEVWGSGARWGRQTAV